MQVASNNDVKQYNLTAGRSLPEWLDERKRRQMLKKDVELRRRVELLQDFDMPTVSNCLRISADGNFVLATGVYKPRVRCYDVHELGLKFERCLDSEVTAFRILSDDYSKLVLMRCNRQVNFLNFKLTDLVTRHRPNFVIADISSSTPSKGGTTSYGYRGTAATLSTSGPLATSCLSAQDLKSSDSTLSKADFWLPWPLPPPPP